MIPALVLRGFGHGSGMLSPDGKMFIVNIPKNASSYIHDWAQHHGWCAALAQNCSSVERLYVMLRDPLERWISGMAQYIKTYILSVQGPNGPVLPHESTSVQDYTMSAPMFVGQYNDLIERLIIDNAARFDDHVWPQNEIIKDVLPGVDRHFFLVDQNLDQKLRGTLGWRDMPDLDRNSGATDADTHLLQQFLQQRLATRPELSARIRRHYQKDYDLMQKVFA